MERQGAAREQRLLHNTTLARFGPNRIIDRCMANRGYTILSDLGAGTNYWMLMKNKFIFTTECSCNRRMHYRFNPHKRSVIDGNAWNGYFTTKDFQLSSGSVICNGKPNLGWGKTNTHSFTCSDGRSGTATITRTSMRGRKGRELQ